MVSKFQSPDFSGAERLEVVQIELNGESASRQNCQMLEFESASAASA